jgi:hypothetical protein
MIRLALAVALAAPVQDLKTEYPDSPEGLQKLNEDVLAAVKADDKAKAGALIRSFALPKSEEWFKRVFGDETGARLQAEYEGFLKDFERQALDLYSKCLQEGRTQVLAVRVHKPGPEATGLQTAALEAMKAPVALYTAKFAKPGEEPGVSLWSFVHVDGTFRLIHKLRTVRAPGK